MTRVWGSFGVGVLLLGCGSAGGGTGVSPISLGDAAIPFVDAGAGDASWPMTDAGVLVGEAGVVPVDRFVTKLVSVTYGACSGFGQGALPGIIEGPPVGAGTEEGSLNVLSLGNGGEMVVSFAPNAIVDGPGVDFIVFENPFWIGGDPNDPYAEPGQISVSDDGVNWTPFTCDATNASGAPYGSCGGWHPVFSSPANGISPFDPSVSGGDPFDLHDIGVTRATFVKIVDQGGEPCTTAINNGFDLDAIAIVNAQNP
jgi:hypothetical protein